MILRVYIPHAVPLIIDRISFARLGMSVFRCSRAKLRKKPKTAKPVLKVEPLPDELWGLLGADFFRVLLGFDEGAGAKSGTLPLPPQMRQGFDLSVSTVHRPVPKQALHCTFILLLLHVRVFAIYCGLFPVISGLL
jgi:hypothetical protein